MGLIGHTKSDAKETIESLLADLESLPAPVGSPDAMLDQLRERGVDFTLFDEWERLDAHEMALGAASERERIKVVSREDMIAAGREAAEEFRASA